MNLNRMSVCFFVLGLILSPAIAGFLAFHRNRAPSSYESYDELHRENARQSRNIVTVYKTRITTNTRVFIIHHAPCAKLVNITGECKMRRGRWVEDPVILTFDDETDKMVDTLYTPVISLEATRKTELHFDDRKQSEILLSEEPMISPSFEDVTDENISDRSARYYLGQIVDALQPLRSRTPAVTKTITFYSTVFTSTKRTSRNTFFVQGCTPSYFPFHICSKH